jgi:Inhibitor of Apoptosis domain/Zinc finger, C3HC4 type (RING finger)
MSSNNSPNGSSFEENGFGEIGLSESAAAMTLQAIGVDETGILRDRNDEESTERGYDYTSFSSSSMRGFGMVEEQPEVSIIHCDNLVHNRPVCSMYSREVTRLQSFRDWPIAMPVSGESIAEAGMYYMGRGDRTQCFFCGLIVINWVQGDDPWEEHCAFSPQCGFLRLLKGEEYITHAKETRARKKALEAEQQQASPVDSIVEKQPESGLNNVSTQTESIKLQDDDDSCTVCMDADRNIAFVPCGHLLTCAVCSLAMKKCPICRSEIASFLSVYKC